MSGAQRPVDDGQIRGLSRILEHWPGLLANASLSAEFSWVQANRKSDQLPRGSVGLLVLYAPRAYLRNQC